MMFEPPRCWKVSYVDLVAVAPADGGEQRAVDPVDDRAVVLAGAAEAALYCGMSVTKMSWHCSMPKGCSSGSESRKLAAAPLLTCMRTSPFA